VVEDAPGIREIVAILPDHSRHVAKVMRFVLTESERDEIFQLQTRFLHRGQFTTQTGTELFR
jgi:hypothetical protein